jgi:hypothetical protein
MIFLVPHGALWRLTTTVYDPAGFWGSVFLLCFIIVLALAIPAAIRASNKAEDIRKGNVNWQDEVKQVRGRAYNQETNEWEDWY